MDYEVRKRMSSRKAKIQKNDVLVMREGELGPRLSLGGSWSLAEQRARDYEKENKRLMNEVQRLSNEVDEMVRYGAKARSEAAAHEAKRRVDLIKERSRKAEESMIREDLKECRETILMAQEDAMQKSITLASHRKLVTKQRTELFSLRSKIDIAEKRLSINENQSRKLIEVKFKQESKITKLQKALELELRAKDLLLHAKQQKDKHLVLLVKERDRLKAQLRASATEKDGLLLAASTPSTLVTPRTSSSGKKFTPASPCTF